MAEASPTMRVIKGLAALAVLIIGLIGVPAFLVVFIGNPLPGVADWSHLLNRLTRPDDGSGLVAIVSVAAWLAWLVLTVSVVLELAAVVSRRRFQMRIPGLAAPQRLASGLVLAVVALSATTPQTGHADPVRTAPQVTPRTVDHQPAETSGTTTTSAAVLTSSSQHGQTPAAQQPATASATHYTVQRGDDLWSLAERFYGEGREWRQIAAANPEVLTGGPDRLEAGWRLTIPDNTAGRSHSYRVRPGDTLSAIADQQLGDPDLWPELYAANRFQLDDPNELSVGVRLELPPPPPAEPGVIGRTDTTPGSSDGAGADTERDGARATSSTSATSVTEPDALPKPVAPPSPTTAQPGEEAGEAPPTGSTTEPLPPAAPDRTQPDPTRTKQAEPEPTPTTAGPVHPVVAGIAGVGGLLAAAIVAGARSRRRVQLQARPVGRRIARPSPVAQLAETHLGRRQRPMGLRTLDLATRAIAAHSHRAQVEPPQLALVTVADDRLEAQLTSESRVAPAGFQVAGNRWRLDAADVDLLRFTPGLADAVRPYPALVTVGVTDEGSQIVTDLEAVRMTSVESSDPDLVEQALAAIAVELSCSPWAEELELILVGTCERLPDALGRHTVTRVDDLDEVLDRLGHRARSQRRQASRASVAAQRVDPDRADAWSPTVLVVNRRLSPVDQVRLQRVVMTGPPVSIAVVGVDLAAAPCRIWLSRRADGSAGARIEPYDVTFTPQVLTAPAADAVIDLVESTGRTDTAPAPWWFDDESDAEPDPPDNVTYLGRRFGGWARSRSPELDRDDQEGAPMGRTNSGAEIATSPHPVLRMLGPVDLTGAAGATPPRAAKQCLEYCGWLLEHPGTSAQEMVLALAVAEGTRRSNMSRLRGWLGVDEVGQPYLPDAYSGRILLHPSVSSDWQRLQILTGRGVNLTSTGGLEAALRLVRGAPLADAAPGQWHWAEGLRTDMISVVRDIGVELAERALADSDVELARWAATRALVVAPGDELLLVARIRTEHRAGNGTEVERLTLQLAAQARALEVDLRPETVDVLQEMMEGRVRARLA